MTTGAVVIAQEGLSRFWQDGETLLARNWQEISAHADIPLSVDLSFYQRLEQQDSLVIVTARASDVLVGYLVFIVTKPPHYSQSLHALQDVFYVTPSARGAFVGARLLKCSETLLMSRGVQVVYQHAKLAHPVLGAILEKRGYAPVEMIYAKRLDRG